MLSSLQFSLGQLLSSVWFFATPLTAACQASLSITNSWSLLKLMSKESVMPCNQIILCRPLFLLPSIFLSIRVFSNELALRIRWPKYWEFQLQHQSFQWIFRADFFQDGQVGSPCSPRDSQESSATPQFKSINSSALSFLYFPLHFSLYESYLSAMVWMTVPCPLPTNSYVVILISKGDDSGRWGLWGVISS